MSSATTMGVVARRGYAAAQTTSDTIVPRLLCTFVDQGSLKVRCPIGGRTCNLRYKSSAATVDSNEIASSGCPFTGNRTDGTTPCSPPNMVNVRTLPFLGSALTSYSNTPPLDPTKLFEFSQEMRGRFGDFYKFGMPGVGIGLHGTLYAMTDPNEFLKVVRAEGSHPSGAVQQLWTFQEALRLSNSALVDSKTGDVGLFGQGELWKKQRTFFQTGMLDPRAAKAYIPSIVEAARLASKGAPKASELNQINYYLNLCAFDMFSSVMLGELTECGGDPSKTAIEKTGEQRHTENIEFCKAAIKAMESSSRIEISIKENFFYQLFGVKYYQTPLFKEFLDNWNEVRSIGLKKVNEFERRYRAGELNEYEQNSYMANALKRFDEQQALGQNDSNVSHGEVMELALLALFAGVDTTSGVVAWNLMHIAMNPSVQEKLYKELKHAVETSGDNKLTSKVLEKKSTPYLHSILVETYRLTPPIGSVAIKTASQSSIEIHGETLPKGSKVLLNPKFNYAHELLEDCRSFRPERWSADEVAARKGTPLEMMDHAIFRDNFGQGARRCPGSRVATNEVLIMLSQLVLDYEIRAPEHMKTVDDVTCMFSALLCPKIPQLKFIPRQQHLSETPDIDGLTAAEAA